MPSYADDDSDARKYMLFDIKYNGYEDISSICIEKDWHQGDVVFESQ